MATATGAQDLSSYKRHKNTTYIVFLQTPAITGQAFSDPRYVENESITAENNVVLQQTVRISLIRDFLEYLCGMEEPLLAFKLGKYVNVAPVR